MLRSAVPRVPAIAAGLLLAACATTVPMEATQPVPAAVAFPADFYRDAARRGAVYTLDPAASTLHVLVFRDGPLARQGHNHLIAAAAFTGAVFLPDAGLDGARMDLVVDADALAVDPAAERAAAGAAFTAPVPSSARAGTRDNMLGPAVLDAPVHPRIGVQAVVVGGELPELVIDATLSLKARSHTLRLPVQVRVDGDTLRARGALVLHQQDLGITPFSAAGGLLRVADPLLVRFEIVGRRTVR